MTTHRKSKTPEWWTWCRMRQRCINPNAADYYLYGGRGITVCDRWLKFENFFADMGLKPSAKHSIDRIDNNGPYSPENCRWATIKEQARNKRTNKNVLGKTINQWAEETGLKRWTIRERIRRGWSIKDAVSIPVK